MGLNSDKTSKFFCINVIQEMKRLELEIMGCSEVRWTQSGKIGQHKMTFLYSDHEKDHMRGVGIFLGPYAAASLLTIGQ